MTIQINSFPSTKGQMRFVGIVTAMVTEHEGVLTGKVPHLGVEATGANPLELHAALVAACAVAYDRVLSGQEGAALRLRWAGAVVRDGSD